MESILIHPENREQLKAIKAVLKALKVEFETQPPIILPSHLSKSIERGIKQFEKGDAISLNEFKAKHMANK